jgi:3-dehydrosphinganine reductase
MDIDYWAAAYLAHATLKAWTTESPEAKEAADYKNASPRHFIMTSSVVAFIGLAGYGPYGPAKAALRNLSDTLRSEIQIYNGARTHKTSPLRVPEIQNHVVFPGGILSPGFEEENKHKHPVTLKLEEDDKPQTEDEVAIASIKGLEKGNYLITTALLGSLMKASSLAASPRNGWGIIDTIFSGIAGLVWSFVGPDLESKVFKWGKENGVTAT